MDGSAAPFNFDASYLSSIASGDAGGILYVEDFDVPASADVADDAMQSCADPILPPLTTDDIDAAREAGLAEGMQAALASALLTQAQLHSTAIQSLTDALRGGQVMLKVVASRHAAECVRMTLAVLQAAVPAVMGKHAGYETEAVLQALTPSLVYEPELRVRVSPQLVDDLRETLAECLQGSATVLSVAADSSLVAGDVHVAWKGGQAKRDCTSAWSAIRSALTLLDLPTLEEVCRGT